MESKSSADSLLSYTHATRQDGVKFSACLPLDICKKKTKKKKQVSSSLTLTLIFENHKLFSCSSRTYNAYFTPTITAMIVPRKILATLYQQTVSLGDGVILDELIFELPFAWNCFVLSLVGAAFLFRSSDISNLQRASDTTVDHTQLLIN